MTLRLLFLYGFSALLVLEGCGGGGGDAPKKEGGGEQPVGYILDRASFRFPSAVFAFIPAGPQADSLFFLLLNAFSGFRNNVVVCLKPFESH